MGSPGKRRRKKAGDPAPEVVEVAKIPAAAPVVAPKEPKPKKKRFFSKDS